MFIILLLKIYLYLTTVFFVSPEIVWSYPLSGDKEFPLESNISISFSRKMIKESVESSIEISPQIEGEFTWEENSIIFKPAKPFDRDQNVTVTINNSARANNFMKVKGKETISFTTLSNPNIVMASPTGSITEEVENIVIMFNKSVRKPEGEILEVTPEVKGESKWVGSSAYMIKTKDLLKGEKYTVRLIKDLDSLDGGKLDQGYEFEFINFAPAVVHMEATSVSYEKNTVSSPFGPVKLFFNQNIDQQSLNDRLRFYRQKDRAEVPFTLSVRGRTKEDNKTYYYDEWESKWEQKVDVYPGITLDPKETYVLQLDSGFKSSIGSATAEFGQSVTFMTADLPGYSSSNIYNGEENIKENRRLEMHFRSPMDRDDLQRNVVIKMNGVVTSEDFFISSNPSSGFVYFNRFLDRSSRFEIYIPSHTKDAYGRQLGQNVNLSFTTAPYDPFISIHPSSELYATFADNVNTRFITRVVNTPTIEYSIYSMDKFKFMDLYEPHYSFWKNLNNEYLLNFGLTLEKTWKNSIEIDNDVITDVIVDVNEDMGIDLKPGFYLIDIRSKVGYIEVQDKMLFNVGDVSLTQKQTNMSTLVWATGLTDREVKDDYNVSVYKLRRSGYTNQGEPILLPESKGREPILTGKTDKEGVFLTNFKPNKDYNYLYITIVEKNGDVGVVMDNWDNGINSYDFGNVQFDNSLYSYGAEKYKGFGLTDRRLYRPGQTVHYKAFLRNNGLNEFSKVSGDGSDHFVIVTIENQKNYYNSTQNVLHKRLFNINDGDIFSGEFTLPEGLELGRYFLEVKYRSDSLYKASFDVQEYVRPEFEVLANVPDGGVIRGDQLSISGEARYFYGAPLSDSEVDYRLYKRNYIFRSKEHSQFNFYSMRKYYGDDSYWSGFEEEELFDLQSITNKEGKVAINASSTTQDGVSEIYTLEVDVLGESGRKFTGTGEYVVHMADHYTGIKSNSYLGETGEKSKFEILTIDPSEEELSDVKVNINVFLRKYFRTKKKDNSEGYLYEVTYEDQLIESDEVKTNDNGKAYYEFEPENAGTHIIQVQSFDDRGNKSISDIYHYVSSKESGYWKRENHDRIDIVTDKSEYKPGDEAKIIPISTLEKAVGLLTIEAEDILEYNVFEQDNSGEVQKFKVKDTYMPNVYVSVTLISPGESVYDTSEFKMGISNINVDTSKQKLEVEVSSDKESYLPGEGGEIFVKVKDNNGNPVSNATVTLALVDDALMSIASLKRDNTFDHFYSPRYHAVRTFQSLTKSLDRININTEIGAKGGSGSKGGAGGEYMDLTRSNFAETALWLPEINTNSNGEATAKFTLPDSITRWNLFALTQDETGAKFGQDVNTFGSSRDIFGLPALPRFLRNGDTSDIGIVVHNTTEDEKDIGVGIEAEGLDVSRGYYKYVKVPKNSSKKVYFNVTAQDGEKAKVTFSVEQNGKLVDAVISEFDILPYGLELVQSFTNAVKYSAFEEFELDPDVHKNYGGLDIKVFGSMLGLVDRSISILMGTKYLSVSSITSRATPLIFKYRFAQLNNDQLMQESTLKFITDDISLLMSAQKADGGWGYWIDAPYSSTYNTTMALEMLGEAGKAGINVNTDAVKKGVKYIESTLSKSQVTQDVSPYTLYVLELNQSDQTGRVSDLYKQRVSLSDIEKAYLIMSMDENKGSWDKQIKQLKSELALKADLGSGRIFWSSSSLGRGYCYVCSDFSTTASVLRAFNRSDPDGPIANLAIRYLTQFKESSWSYLNYHEKGKEIAILENVILRNIKTRDSNVSVLLNGEEKISGQIAGKDPNSKVEANIPVTSLTDGTNTVEVKLDKGGNAFYSMVLTTLMPFDIVEEDSNEIGLVRELYDFNGNKILNNRFEVGESYIVRLTIATPNIRRNVILEDFLPAGFESVNDTLENESAQSVQAARTAEDVSKRYYLIDSQQMKDSSTQIQMSYIPQGLYEYSYVVRAIVPGEYKYRPAHIFEENSPDIRANTSGSYVVVEE
jgi:uncharacterized protein YfaS (alpha-2-macroglobulin family)